MVGRIDVAAVLHNEPSAHILFRAESYTIPGSAISWASARRVRTEANWAAGGAHRVAGKVLGSLKPVALASNLLEDMLDKVEITSEGKPLPQCSRLEVELSLQAILRKISCGSNWWWLEEVQARYFRLGEVI
jgi:hypothetical protein